MIVVPNHMLGQFSTELLTLYPGANILVAGKEDFESKNRKKLFSRIATGNWDAVIVTHSGFERIPLTHDTQKRFFEEQLHELEVIRLQNADTNNRRLVKELERAKKRLEARLQALAADHKKDNTLTFEELGVDRLFVDEAHYFKNLFYLTKMTRIAGLPQTASERAFDMFLKVRHVQSLNGGEASCLPPARPSPTAWRRCSPCSGIYSPMNLKSTIWITSMLGPRLLASQSRRWNFHRTALATV